MAQSGSAATEMPGGNGADGWETRNPIRLRRIEASSAKALAAAGTIPNAPLANAFGVRGGKFETAPVNLGICARPRQAARSDPPESELGTGTESSRCPIVLFPPEQALWIGIGRAEVKENFDEYCIPQTNLHSALRRPELAPDRGFGLLEPRF